MCAAALCVSHVAFAECNTQACDREGITDTEIKIGSACALSGPLVVYSPIHQGMKAAFDKKNSEGGVHGRKINFIYYDHAYSTTKAVEQVKRLIDQDKVFAMVGLLGTPPFLATEPMLKERMISNINVVTGSTTLIDNPVKHYPSWVFLPSYASYTYGMLTAIA